MVTIYIEGKTKTPKGELREGFRKLISKKIGWDWESKTKLVLGGGKQETIKDFFRDNFSQEKFLLVDLDAEEGKREIELKNLDLEEYSDQVFFMIQEMEGWFFSQPEKLQEHYSRCDLKFPGKPAKAISSPSSELLHMTEGCPEGRYQKIADGLAVLKKLDPNKLMADFPEDFGRLIETLQKL